MSWLTLALWSVGLLAGLYLLGFAITAHRFLRMRLVSLRFEPSAEEALPDVLRGVFQRARDEL
ncbi:MAG TPA: hypothetical protein VFZ61_23930, partial [Polyangiales bacterium]